MIADRRRLLESAPLLRRKPGTPREYRAHRQALRFAAVYPDSERRCWAYEAVYRWAIRHEETPTETIPKPYQANNDE